MIGETISHYKILEKLGSGGMGVVYKAEDTKLYRTVALKFLPPEFVRNEEAKQRFIHEAQAASSLQHNNICNIHDIQETGEGQLFIIMDCYEGESLKDKIAKGPIGIDEAINITIQVCEGLEKAHKNDIVHRDIKPANIFITNDGIVKILDFGLAKAKGQTQLTKMDSTLGTVDYMSPEQADGKVVDRRTDIWSIGVVLYEMLTGKRPFAAEYEQAVIYSILNKEPEVIPDINNRIQHIINEALAKSPDDRYQSAGEIVEELNKIESGKSTEKVRKKSKLPWMMAAAAAIIIAVGIYLYVPSSNTVKETETIKTIAVLPFTDMSPNKDQEYFSDGIADELINTLSRNPKLRVIARTSSFYFKGKDVNIKTIAQTLNVKHILEGSVRKSGNNLRISADLVNAETEATLWSSTYDGTMNNIFALQDSISGNVAEALKAALLGEGAPKTEQKTDPEAYNYYLLGKHFYELHSKETYKKAEGYYEKAISIDSNYAPAWAGLSQVHTRQVDAGYGHSYIEARKEVQKAIKLDPNLADAYAHLGWIKIWEDWDWAGADEVFKKGLGLDPGNINVINGAANLAAKLGRFEEAIKLLRRVITINPVSVAGYSNLGIYSWYAGLLDESIAYHRKCLELGSFRFQHLDIARNYLEKDKPDSALTEVQKEINPFWKLYGFALVYHALGRKKEADYKLAELIKNYQSGWAYQIAEVYAYRNEIDKAFEWLDKAYNQHDGGCTMIKSDPLMRNIVKDPRYAAFMKKMKLPL